MTSPLRILIACGGTGGHLAPGIALAQQLIARGHECELLISQKQVDQRLIQKYPQLTFRNMPATGLGRTHSAISPASLFQFTLSQISSINFCSKVFKAFRPHAVVGFGGFSSVGATVYASSHGIPVYLHEANYRVGRSIRTLAGMATTIYLPPGSPSQGLPKNKIKHLGLPIRADMEFVSKAAAREALGFPAEGKLLVVMGGSQGSGPLNDWARHSWGVLQQNDISLCCLTGLGKTHPDELSSTHHHGPRALFLPFSDQMHLFYAAADLVVARAGAGTIAELTTFHTPSILVPYPFAADNHQLYNARHLEKQGGTVVIDESELKELLPAALTLLQKPGALSEIQSALHQLSPNNAAEQLCQEIENALQKTNKQHSRHSSDLEVVFAKELKQNKIDPTKIKLSFNEPLGPKTTFGIGGPARIYAEPTNEKELLGLLKITRRHHLPFFVMGRGSNLLVLDKGFRGLVIRLHHPHWQRLQLQADDKIKAYAGVRLKVLCAEASKYGLEGFEFMEGIPATLGGALHMNAGAFNAWTFDRVDRVAFLTPKGQLKVAAGKSLKPGYRHVAGLRGAIVLWATLQGTQKKPSEAIKATMESFQTKRKGSQPREASAGCVFKNPSDTIKAGQTIDQLGLKGFTVGSAMVSPIHANFIVNTGQAKAEDVIGLINVIRKKAWDDKKILLEPEIMLLGGHWNDYLKSPEDETRG